MTASDLVKIWSFEHDAWWAPHSIGYTNNEAGAGLYDRKEAKEIVRQANRGGVVNEGIVEIERPASKVATPTPLIPLAEKIAEALWDNTPTQRLSGNISL